MKNVLDSKVIHKVMLEAYDKFKDEQRGKNADYIPYLANIDKDLFGIVVSLPNGEVLEVGNTDYAFGIESVSKVLTALLAMKQYSPEELLARIGADATGLPFNSVMALLLENNHPSTPLVNAGAISACSMIKPLNDPEGKWESITKFFSELCGSDLVLIDELYRSETETNFTNKAISWLLKSYDRIYDTPEMALDLYTRQCSLGITARQLAICGGTIANSGVNPVSQTRIFPGHFTPKIVSLIATVGFYEKTGEWMYSSGIPAKSGVGGGVMAVLPGVMSIAAFAPPLDKSGNSVKAQEAIRYIANSLGLNIFAPCI